MFFHYSLGYLPCRIFLLHCVWFVQENRAQRVRETKMNKSISDETNGEDDSVGDTSSPVCNGDAANNC